MSSIIYTLRAWDLTNYLIFNPVGVITMGFFDSNITITTVDNVTLLTKPIPKHATSDTNTTAYSVTEEPEIEENVTLPMITLEDLNDSSLHVRATTLTEYVSSDNNFSAISEKPLSHDNNLINVTTVDEVENTSMQTTVPSYDADTTTTFASSTVSSVPVEDTVTTADQLEASQTVFSDMPWMTTRKPSIQSYQNNEALTVVDSVLNTPLKRTGKENLTSSSTNVSEVIIGMTDGFHKFTNENVSSGTSAVSSEILAPSSVKVVKENEAQNTDLNGSYVSDAGSRTIGETYTVKKGANGTVEADFQDEISAAPQARETDIQAISAVQTMDELSFTGVPPSGTESETQPSDTETYSPVAASPFTVTRTMVNYEKVTVDPSLTSSTDYETVTNPLFRQIYYSFVPSQEVSTSGTESTSNGELGTQVFLDSFLVRYIRLRCSTRN